MLDVTTKVGESWTNNTGVFAWQRIVQWVNSCALCGQYHLVIHTQREIPTRPLHRKCNCDDVMIPPGQSGAAFADVHKIVAGLPEDMQRVYFGASNWQMVESGLIKFRDVATPYRVRTLTEVVQVKNLTRGQMLKAGVKEQVVKKVFATIEHPELAGKWKEIAELITDIAGEGRPLIVQVIAKEVSLRAIKHFGVGLDDVAAGADRIAREVALGSRSIESALGDLDGFPIIGGRASLPRWNGKSTASIVRALASSGVSTKAIEVFLKSFGSTPPSSAIAIWRSEPAGVRLTSDELREIEKIIEGGK